MRFGKDRSEARPTGSSLTPVDVQQVQFRLAFRGYNEGDVDAFLDRITEELTARIEERERLLVAGLDAAAAIECDSNELLTTCAALAHSSMMLARIGRYEAALEHAARCRVVTAGRGAVLVFRQVGVADERTYFADVIR